CFQSTVNAIKLLRDAGIQVQVNCTMIQNNFESIPFLTRLSRDLDISVRMSLLNPKSGRARGLPMATEALDVYQILALREYCNEIRKMGSKVFLNLPPILQYPEDIPPIRSPACGWTQSYCGVLHNGDVTICGVAGDCPELVAGNLYKDSFSKIWSESKLFTDLRQLKTSDLRGICGRCKFRDTCGGACRLSGHKTGNMLNPYPLCQTFYDEGLIPEEILAV
ncbi:MAG: SPASM domain-containing protein, partial [Nitrosopumilus sp.]